MAELVVSGSTTRLLTVLEVKLNEHYLPEFIPSPENRAIFQSVRIKPGYYEIPDHDGKGALIISADDITVDFNGAIISSCDVKKADREKFTGCGINIEGRKNITLINGAISGYHYNIRAVGCDNLRIENCDVSISRAHRVMNGSESLDIWLEIRDLNFWKSYGGGIWIEKSTGCTVKGCKGHLAQDGLFLISSDHCMITENDFSYNSGWGIALWEACDNIVTWNLIDFVSRPWRGGLGADSAAMAVSNGSHRNYIIGNSMTHGDDGFFLTNLSDTGYDEKQDRFILEGASNDNIVAYNDGSWSPANAFEGTFSDRNVYYRNYANDSGYGFWLGFSNYTLVLENEICRNRVSGIAIEHGRGNRFERNLIEDNPTSGINLFAGRHKPGEEYPSTDIEIRDNVIRRSDIGLDLTGSTSCYLEGNILEYAPVQEGLVCDKAPDESDALTKFLESPQYARLQEILKSKPKDYKMYRESGRPCGVELIKAGEYAPLMPEEA